MPDRLHWNTVKPIVKEVLTLSMQNNLFDPFRLVVSLTEKLSGKPLLDSFSCRLSRAARSLTSDADERLLIDS